jgi:hypothetical protein
MTMTKIEAIWQVERAKAESQPVASDGLRLTRIDPVGSLDIYAGVSDSLMVVLAVGVSTRPPAVALQSGALDYFRRRRADGSWLMVLRLKLRELEQVFGRLCQDLIDATTLVQTQKELVALMVARLKLWEMLFSGTKDGLLGINQIRGLVAELLVLEDILTTGRRGIADAVEGWVGPLRADRDFEYPDVSLEVKSLSPGRRGVTITSLAQLASDGPLVLVATTLSSVAKTDAEAFCLNSLVGRIEGKVSSNTGALALLKEKLILAGYVEHLRYETDWFLRTQTRFFDVAEGFPRLVASNVPDGILSVSYEIELASLSTYERKGGIS